MLGSLNDSQNSFRCTYVQPLPFLKQKFRIFLASYLSAFSRKIFPAMIFSKIGDLNSEQFFIRSFFKTFMFQPKPKFSIFRLKK